MEFSKEEMQLFKEFLEAKRMAELPPIREEEVTTEPTVTIIEENPTKKVHIVEEYPEPSTSKDLPFLKRKSSTIQEEPVKRRIVAGTIPIPAEIDDDVAKNDTNIEATFQLVSKLFGVQIMANLTKLWKSKRNWFTVKVFEEKHKVQLACQRKGTIGWSLPYVKGDRFLGKLEASYDPNSKWTHPNLMKTLVRDWKVAKEITNVLDMFKGSLSSKMRDIKSELFSVNKF